MDGGKRWWQSKAIIASLVALLCATLRGFGLEVADAEATQVALDVVSAVSTVYAIYGRVTATQPIVSKAGNTASGRLPPAS